MRRRYRLLSSAPTFTPDPDVSDMCSPIDLLGSLIQNRSKPNSATSVGLGPIKSTVPVSCRQKLLPLQGHAKTLRSWDIQLTIHSLDLETLFISFAGFTGAKSVSYCPTKTQYVNPGHCRRVPGQVRTRHASYPPQVETFQGSDSECRARLHIDVMQRRCGHIVCSCALASGKYQKAELYAWRAATAQAKRRCTHEFLLCKWMFLFPTQVPCPASLKHIRDRSSVKVAFDIAPTGSASRRLGLSAIE